LNNQAKHVAYVLSELRSRGHKTVEVSAAAEQEYVEEIQRLSRSNTQFYAECTPGYYNSEGKPGNRNGFFSEMYGAGPVRFFEVLEEWRANGLLEGLELS
jgi:cyclohexanone monooxygenase